MNEANKNKSWIYPGNVWKKRITKILILSTIGINLFINVLQERLLISSAKMHTLATSLKDPAKNLKDLTEEKIIPILDYMENSALSKITNSLPSSKDLNIHIKNYSLLQSTLADNSKMLNFLGMFLKVANIIFWISISFSTVWLLYDIQFGDTKLITLLLLCLATWFSHWSYCWLLNNIML